MNRVAMTVKAITLGLSLLAGIVMSGPAFAAGSGGGRSSSSGPSSYIDSVVPVETMQITLIQTAQVRGTLVVSIGLHIADPVLREEVEHAMPRLRDAYIFRLSRHGATRIDPRRVPDVELISELLQATTDQVLGQEGAEVLLANVLVRSGLNRRGAIGSR